MTTQAIQAVVGSGSFSRAFSDTATDAQWTANILTDDVAQTNLGLVMPNQMIDTIQVNYTAGACLWRIQSSQSLLVKRYGYASLDGYSCWESSKIAPYRVAPDDILVVYPMPSDAGPTLANALSWITTSRGYEAFGVTAAVSGAAKELTSLVNGQSIGDYAFNAVLQAVTVQVEDGASVDKVELVDQVGGVIWTGYGGYRLPTAGGKSEFYNFKVDGLAIPILKGYTIKVTLTAA